MSQVILMVVNMHCQYLHLFRLKMCQIGLIYSITHKFNCISFITNRVVFNGNNLITNLHTTLYTTTMDISNMIVSRTSKNNFCRMVMCLVLSILFTYSAYHQFIQLLHKLVLKWGQFKMFQVPMYVFVNSYSLYVEICLMLLK